MPERGSAHGRRAGKAARKGIGGFTALELAFGPRQHAAALVEECDPDHADVSVIALASCIGIFHRAEAEGRHRRLTAAEAVDLQRAPGIDQVAALFEAAVLAVDDIETIDRGDRFEAIAGVVFDLNDVALTIATRDIVLACEIGAGQRRAVFIQQAHADGTLRDIDAAAIEACVGVAHAARHGLDAGVVVVVERDQRKGARVVSAVEARTRYAAFARFAPSRAQARTLLGLFLGDGAVARRAGWRRRGPRRLGSGGGERATTRLAVRIGRRAGCVARFGRRRTARTCSYR